jgi:hypothetical protein
MVYAVKIFERDWLFLVAHDLAGRRIHKMHARASGAGHSSRASADKTHAVNIAKLPELLRKVE